MPQIPPASPLALQLFRNDDDDDEANVAATANRETKLGSPSEAELTWPRLIRYERKQQLNPINQPAAPKSWLMSRVL